MPAIRRHVFIAASPRTVWKALTTVEGLEKWCADEARIDPRKGGRVVFQIEDAEGEPVEERGIIHTWRPTSHLEIAWDSIGSFPTKSTQVTFKVARDGDETRLSLVHRGAVFDEDEELRAWLDDEWKGRFEFLQSWLDES